MTTTNVADGDLPSRRHLGSLPLERSGGTPPHPDRQAEKMTASLAYMEILSLANLPATRVRRGASVARWSNTTGDQYADQRAG
jgi:hypothetical protein